jgi:hypothetical protein
MVHYKVKGGHSASTYLEIIEETAEGYTVSIVQEFENCRKVTQEFMGRDLFESCLRTGYLTRIESADLMTA